ncbi:nucleotide disphospho-sugar-binding domain-containing protein [Streptomyces sp. NPDC048483]|uniref:nucleotide disphospho-sugar-binding domain-containing protein n=1 Tax=Streptomyces sp. NPDC048483 TaxID=3154927 RepID=UPI00341B0055
MRVLFTTSDISTHWFPMVPLGWALQSAGHEVRLACTPRAAGQISRTGLTPLPVLDGPDHFFKARLARYRALTASGAPVEPGTVLHPVTGEPMASLADFDIAEYAARNREHNLAMMRGSCDRIAAFARSWRPDLVVTEPQNVEGVLAAQLLGVPSVCHLFSTVGTHEPGPGLGIVLEDHSDSFPRLGLPEMSADLIDHVIDPCPPGLGGACEAPRLPVRFVPYNGPGTAPDWATERPAERPRVLVSWSTVVSKVWGRQTCRLPTILDGLAELDAEVVVAAAPEDRAELGTLPRNARLLETWAPLNQLLPACEAIVHHGGGGSMLAALVAGVPQLSLAITPEQAANGERLAADGAGLAADGRAATAGSVRGAVAALLGETRCRGGAAALRDAALAQPGPAELVGTLERLSRTGAA